MSGRIRNYYADGNTAKGFYNFYKSNIDGMEHVYILKGLSCTSKSAIMRKTGINWLNKGFDVEFMHTSSDNNPISGIIIPQLKFAIVDGTKSKDVENAIAKTTEYIDLNEALDFEKIAPYKDSITKLGMQKQEMLQSAYTAFSKALSIHDEWERIYITNMNFNKINKLTEKLSKTVFTDKALNKESVVRHRFLGAATAEGSTDFINNLTYDIQKRYFIKGRPGSGKSTLLKKIISKAQHRGFDAEVYHCGFDPNSLDMVIIRELGVCIFDSTSPHEHFPERENDEIIDIYKEAITLGTDEKYALELQDISKRYKEKIQNGISFLKKAKKLNDELEIIYSKATDFDYIEKVSVEINSKIKITEGV